MGVYKRLRSMYFNPVMRQILRDSRYQIANTLEAILHTPRKTLVTAFAFFTINAGIANLSFGAIKNPFESQDYMKEVAAKLKSEEGKNLLLNGSDIQKHVQVKKNPFEPQDYIKKVAGRLISEEGRNLLLNGFDISRYTQVEKYPAPTYKPQAKPHEKEKLQKAFIYVIYDREKGPSESLKKALSNAGIDIDLEEDKATSPTEKPQDDFKEQLKEALYRNRTTKKAWNMGDDLNQYRDHAFIEGSRNPGENFKKAGYHLCLTIDDLANVIKLAYHSDRAKQFTENDGKPLSFYLDQVGKAGGLAIVAVRDGVYSIADLVVLDSLPNIKKPAYQDNHPLVRPFVFTGCSIGYSWKTIENIGNVPTGGLFDNATGSAGKCVEDILESSKHLCEAGTNLARGPFYIVLGKSENLDRILDWPTLVIFEYLSNVIEMKGISNMQNYKYAFDSKGVIASIAELGGSGYLVIRAGDEIVEELEHEPSKRRAPEKKVGPPPLPDFKPDGIHFDIVDGKLRMKIDI